MEGVSSHFDHTLGRCVVGRQVGLSGLVSEEHFLLLDAHDQRKNQERLSACAVPAVGRKL